MSFKIDLLYLIHFKRYCFIISVYYLADFNRFLVNILDKFTKLSKAGFSGECFTAAFSQFSSTTVKNFQFG